MGNETLLTLQGEGLSKLQLIINSLTGKERDDLLVLLQGDKIERKERALCIVIDELKKNHVGKRPEELKYGGEIYKGERVCLDLGGQIFECFIPHCSFSVDRSDRKISNLISDRGVSFDDIVGLFNMVGDHVKKTLSNIDDSLVIKQCTVTKSLDGSVERIEGNDVGRCVVDVLGLKDRCYFLDAYKLSIHDGFPKCGCLFVSSCGGISTGTIKYSGIFRGGALLLK